MPSMNLAEAYIQVNTIKGNRYLDDAGKIMNAYDDEFPEKEVGLEGLNMKSGESKVRAVRVTTDRIWVNIHRPDTLTYAMDHAFKIIERISDIIAVASFKRVAMRLQYFVDVGGTQNTERLVVDHALSPAASAALGEIWTGERVLLDLAFRIKHGDLLVNLHVAQSHQDQRAKTEDELPARAIIIDPDIFRLGEFSLLAFRRFLRDAEQWTRSDLQKVVAAFVPGR